MAKKISELTKTDKISSDSSFESILMNLSTTSAGGYVPFVDGGQGQIATTDLETKTFLLKDLLTVIYNKITSGGSAGDTKENTKLYMDSYLKQNPVAPEYADLTNIILPAINYSNATPDSKGMFWYQLMNQFIIDRKTYSTGSSSTTPTYELTAPLTIFSKPIGPSSSGYSQPTEIKLLPKWNFGLILFTDPRTTTLDPVQPFNVKLHCPTEQGGINEIDNIVYTSFVSTDNQSHSTGALRLLFYYTNPTMGVGFDGKLFTLI